jgi:hypothetical protein
VRNWPPWQACQKAPEGLVETLLGRRVCVEERFDLRVHAERCSQPQLTDGRASLDQKAGHVPAAVADRIVERAPAGDRRAGSLDIGPAIDKRGRTRSGRPAGPPSGMRPAALP